MILSNVGRMATQRQKGKKQVEYVYVIVPGKGHEGSGLTFFLKTKERTELAGTMRIATSEGNKKRSIVAKTLVCLGGNRGTRQLEITGRGKLERELLEGCSSCERKC